MSGFLHTHGVLAVQFSPSFCPVLSADKFKPKAVSPTPGRQWLGSVPPHRAGVSGRLHFFMFLLQFLGHLQHEPQLRVYRETQVVAEGNHLSLEHLGEFVLHSSERVVASGKLEDGSTSSRAASSSLRTSLPASSSRLHGRRGESRGIRGGLTVHRQ